MQPEFSLDIFADSHPNLARFDGAFPYWHETHFIWSSGACLVHRTGPCIRSEAVPRMAKNAYSKLSGEGRQNLACSKNNLEDFQYGLMDSELPSGTYFISCHLTRTYLSFNDGLEFTNLSASVFDGDLHQQWIVSSTDGRYSFKNSRYGTYISYENRNVTSNPFVYGSATKYTWFVEKYKSGYLIASPDVEYRVLNLAGAAYDNNSNIILYPFLLQPGPDNEVWLFNLTTPTSPTTTTSSTCLPSTTMVYPNVTTNQVSCHSHVGAIVGGVLGTVLGLVLLVMVFVALGGRTALIRWLQHNPPQYHDVPPQHLAMTPVKTPSSQGQPTSRDK